MQVNLRNSRVEKAAKALPLPVFKSFMRLIDDLRSCGPVRGNWPNYSKLGKTRHHCHLKKGKPTYVVVWSEENGAVFIDYVGTHESAPY